MLISDYIRSTSTPFISFEIIPPKRGESIQAVLPVLDELAKYQPPFIDVTSHAGEIITADQTQRKIPKKRPGTLGICALIQHKYGIEAVPHVLCKGFTRQETEDFLIDIAYTGMTNVMALQGDAKGYTETEKSCPQNKTIENTPSNTYALDLVEQIKDLTKGIYLESSGGKKENSLSLCVGVAGYPEKHQDAPNMGSDLYYLQQKINAGAQYIVTQMFFDNHHYFNFVRRCRHLGITVPIIPGLKIITSQKQLATIPRSFQVKIPSELEREISTAKPEHVLEIGVSWCYRQIEELLNRSQEPIRVPGVHLYTMLDVKPIQQLMKKIR